MSTLVIVCSLLLFWVSPSRAAEPRTEGQFLDPSCNCVRTPEKNGLVDPDMVRKIEEEARAGAGKKLLAQVKSYRCPRVAKKKDDVDLTAYGIEGDDDEAPEVTDVMDALLAKAGVDESMVDGETRARAEESLEKKLEKCRSSRTATARRDGTGGGSANTQQQQMQMMMLLMSQRMNSMSSMGYGMGTGLGYGMNSGMGYGMNYGMGYGTNYGTGYGLNYGLGTSYNPSLMMSSMLPMTSGYNPYATLAGTSSTSLGLLTPAQQVALRGYGGMTSSLASLTPAQQAMWNLNGAGNTWNTPYFYGLRQSGR